MLWVQINSAGRCQIARSNNKGVQGVAMLEQFFEEVQFLSNNTKNHETQFQLTHYKTCSANTAANATKEKNSQGIRLTRDFC